MGWGGLLLGRGDEFRFLGDLLQEPPSTQNWGYMAPYSGNLAYLRSFQYPEPGLYYGPEQWDVRLDKGSWRGDADDLS